jgi:hypothetical protein
MGSVDPTYAGVLRVLSLDRHKHRYFDPRFVLLELFVACLFNGM